MFKDPSVLDGKIVIGFFSALLCLGTVAQIIAILKISGCFLEKKKETVKKHTAHIFKRGQKVIVNIHDRYSVGIVQAHDDKNNTVHIVFSDRDPDKIESEIENCSTIEGLVVLSKHISSVTSAQIKATGANATAVKNLLRKQLQNRSVRADHVYPSHGIGLFKKLKLRCPKFFNVIARLQQLFLLYRFSNQISNPSSQPFTHRCCVLF